MPIPARPFLSSMFGGVVTISVMRSQFSSLAAVLSNIELGERGAPWLIPDYLSRRWTTHEAGLLPGIELHPHLRIRSHGVSVAHSHLRTSIEHLCLIGARLWLKRSQPPSRGCSPRS